MDNRTAYNQWAKTYDQMKNKTRDLEAEALRSLLEKYDFNSCLEIGCGTGKNTQWLASRASRVTAVDFSEEMIAKAKTKDLPPHVEFMVADVTRTWDFTKQKYDLVSFSLVLEHLEDLNHIFQEASKVLRPNGILYLGELHPFKQYLGSKARFETPEGEHKLDCFTHHFSEYIFVGKINNFRVEEVKEAFWEAEITPQVLALIMRGL